MVLSDILIGFFFRRFLIDFLIGSCIDLAGSCCCSVADHFDGSCCIAVVVGFGRSCVADSCCF